MVVFTFSIMVLIGLVPAVFILDRLFSINFEKSPIRRPGSKGVFWEPRGIAETGSKDADPPARRPIIDGLKWIFVTPESLASEQLSMVLLRAYRFCVLFSATAVVFTIFYFVFVRG